jgi:hypothetical protein
MKVDHLVADVDGAGVRVLDYLQTETAIKGEHLLSVLHRKSNMIEASDASSLLRYSPGFISQSTRGNYATDEPSPGKALHCAPRHMTDELAIEVYQFLWNSSGFPFWLRQLPPSIDGKAVLRYLAG